MFSTVGTTGIYACGVVGYEDDEARSPLAKTDG